VIVYQEQIIRIMRDLAGYSGGEADVIRRAISKKYEKIIAKHQIRFREGCVANGIPGEKADEIYAAIEYFANYGFNKAHAADYAEITCQTAYLKAKYPVEYMAALLTVEQDNTDKVAVFLAECRRLGIPVLPPDVDASDVDFTIEENVPEQYQVPSSLDSKCSLSGGAIRFGLGAVKNVSAVAVHEIIRARREGGPFQSLDDFSERVDLRKINRRMLECLIKVGALDQFGTRAQLLGAMDNMISLSSQIHQAQDVGQMTMFDMFGTDEHAVGGIMLPDVPSLSNKVRLGWEKELVGFYVSEHPLNQVAATLQGQVTCYCGEVTEEMHGQPATLAGIVSWIRPHITRKGDLMAFVHLEDVQGSIEVIVFPRTYANTRDLWQEDKILVVRGKIDADGRDPALICEFVQDHVVVARAAPEEQVVTERLGSYAADKSNGGSEARFVSGNENGGARNAPRHLQITIRRSGNQEQDKRRVGQVYGMLQQHRGQDQFTFVLVDSRRRVEIDFPNATTSYSYELAQSLRAMLGGDALRVT
jgi:DNA polymerase-3 subunit alpha